MPELVLESKDLARVLRGAPETLRSVVRGDIEIILAVANLFVTGMKESIRAPKSGKIYRRKGVPHQASKPGEPPASDFGILINSISAQPTRVDEFTSSAGVGVDGTAPYWEPLEFGSRFMEPRPFVRPVYEAGKNEAITKFTNAWRRKTKARLRKRRGTRIG